MRIIRITAVAALLGASSGCVVSSGGHIRSAAPCLAPLLCMAANPDLVVGAALVTVALLHHDAHVHGRCHCPTRIWEGQRVYWYGGHWEFYSAGRWYMVPDCPPPY